MVRSAPFVGVDCANMPTRTDNYEVLANEIQDKSEDDVKKYYPVFVKKWKQLSGTYFRLSRAPTL
jgi:hypothetical protein